jgi:tRNA(Ile)-lysidine synthase
MTSTPFPHDPHAALGHELLRSWPTGKLDATRALIACSGGPDSVALVRLLRAIHPLPAALAVAHYNHRLRGQSSDGDAQFVCDLCRVLELPFFSGSATDEGISASRGGQGWEAAARGERYAFLLRTAEQWGARYLVTGHTADDQIETVLHQTLRGSGLQGLAGIPARRVLSEAVTLIRPMLSLRRDVLRRYLQEISQPFREDETNASPAFARNWIRHELLPLLKQRRYPGVEESLLRLAHVAQDAQAAIRPWAESVLDASQSEATKQSATLHVSALRSVPIHVAREAFVVLWSRQDWPRQSMGWNEWQRLVELVHDARAATIGLPGGVEARRLTTPLDQLVLRLA